MLALFSAAAPLAAQDISLEPILPSTLSDADVVLQGRYVRQWKQDDGTLTLMYNGGFALEFARRRLSSQDAVIWIAPRTDEQQQRYYELTLYLLGRAEVQEPSGTIVQDSALLVSNLRTRGRITKMQDAHSPEPMESSKLYQRALADRRQIESARPAPASQESTVQVARPSVSVERPAPSVRFQFGQVEPAATPDGDAVYVATGGVYFSRSGSSDSPPLEIRADRAVVFPAAGATERILPALEGAPAAEPEPRPPSGAGGQAGGPSGEPLEQTRRSVERQLKAVYLEGDVVLTLGERFVRTSRLYYDFEADRALMLDAVLRAEIPSRNIPLYVRAEEVRQLSVREFSAEHARVSTSEFYTPHYSIGAASVYLYDRTERGARGQAAGAIVGTYEAVDTTLNVEDAPLLWWPYSRGDFESGETLLRGIRTGYSEEFGVEFESYWHLFNLLGLQTPPGFKGTLALDYYSKRGPGVGTNVEYKGEDYFGLFDGYYINDGGDDRFGPLRENNPDTPNRGRLLLRHRQYLPNDWEASFEFAYASDPGFLETYKTSEWFEDKPQETAVYLKRAQEVDAVTLLANWRLLEFTTQTEHLPDLAYRRIGDLLGPFVLYHESRVGALRYRPDDRYFFDERNYLNDGQSDVTARADAREEAELPLKLGALNVVPFASLRGSYWDGQPLDSGGLWRGLGVYGVRGGTYLSRVYDDVRSDLLDIDRIRHVIQPQFEVWWAHSNTRSELITPFDEGIETIDDFYGGLIGLRQTWQTKRGAGDNRRTVDLLALDLEAGFFGQQQPDETSSGYVNFIRPEDSRTRNHLSGNLVYRMTDSTSLLYDFNFDLNDRSFDRHDVSVAVERLPRLAYVFGWRHAGDLDLNLLGGGYNYKLNEKHITALRAWYDADRGQLGELTFSYVKRLPRWYVAFNIEVDEVNDDVSVSLSMWPEGIPEWTVGSRRFTGLSTTTGIKP